MNIRLATNADARPIAEIHVASWQTTYRDFMDATFLDNLSVERRFQLWNTVTADSESQDIIVVADDPRDSIVGFASAGPERDGNPAYRAELYAIYLLESVQRQGVGRLLTAEIVGCLAEAGYDDMLVWVLADNPSRYFYEALGGEVVGSKTISLGNRDYVELAYGWKNLLGLQASLKPPLDLERAP